MVLDIGAALSAGVSRATNRNGLLLLGLFALLSVVSGLATSAVVAELLPQFVEQFERTLVETAQQQGDPELAEQYEGISAETEDAEPLVPIPYGVAVALGLLALLLTEAVRIVADRTFVSDETEGLYEPTRNLPLALVNSIVAAIVVGVVVGVGFLVGLVGLFVGGPILASFLAMSFFFVRQEIAVEDENFVDALLGSWSLAKGDRLQLFVLALVLFIVGVLFNQVLGLVTGVIPGVAGLVVNSVVTAAVAVFASAVAADAYRQLVAAKRTPASAERLDDADEWNDPAW
ncbi:hypothetical protein [Halomarina ordinaria]|uniref:DUF7847 domain-containing protein n=1 Tax=Halomarina ordinaria TaxID=3033939 RepID=A0ABD5U4N8_9EURY|nr:hypothetical protein [Halomarina sp. PSRA2]